MTNVREVLDDVIRDDAHEVSVDALGAWQEGRRRRTRRRVGTVAAVVVVIVGAGLASLAVVDGRPNAVGPAGGTSDDIATEHPQRLDYAYWDDDQPRVTGPLAGVVQRSGEETSGWYSVSQEGHLWRLDSETDTIPSLSPDGRHLAYLRGGYEDAVYVITDQVDGTEVTIPEIGPSTATSDTPYFHSDQAPSFWSPDGSSVLVRIGKYDADASGPDPAAAIVGTDGTFTVVPPPEGAGDGVVPLGWLNDDRVVLASSERQGKVHIWIVDVDKGLWDRDFDLESGAARFRETYQWFGSANGRLLVVASEEQVRYFALEPTLQGRVYSTSTGVPNAADSCPSTWADGVYVPTATDRDTGESAILVRAQGGTTVLADPRLDIVCSSWAASAIDGPAHQSWGTRLFGDDSSWISWHWREVTLAAAVGLVLLLAAGGLVFLRRRAR